VGVNILHHSWSPNKLCHSCSHNTSMNQTKQPINIFFEAFNAYKIMNWDKTDSDLKHIWSYAQFPLFLFSSKKS
jgi:hypothetical protein